MSLHRSETHKIHEWWQWVEICAEMEINPYENVDCGWGIGGGDSVDYIYLGDIPERKAND